MSFSSERPSKVLYGQATTVTPGDLWPHDDGTGEKWWQGGSNPKPYRWFVNIDITQQDHGSQLTREPYEYNGLDVKVGDWVAATGTGVSVRVISVVEKSELTVQVELEDVNRYNTFQSPFGDGIFTIPGACIVFEIGEEDLPVLNPLPPQITQVNFITQVQARFAVNNPLHSYRIEQSHTFEANDVIWVNPVSGLYEVATGDDTKYMIGTIHRVIVPNVFYFVPTTKVMDDLYPILPAAAGDTIYVDATGALTASVGTNNKAAYRQLSNAIADTVTGTVVSPTTTAGTILSINGIEITFSGTTIATTESDINTYTNLHGVVASQSVGDTIAVTNSGDLNYGVVGAIGPVASGMQASINGVTVTFNITASGTANGLGAGNADARDMAEVINNAAIPGIIADGGIAGAGGILTITSTLGAPITIVNITGDGSGIPFAGPASCSGVALSTPASTDAILRLSNASGYGIELYDVVNTPRADFGLLSSANGHVPLGLVIEQSIRQGTTFVVADITAKDALTPIIGDQAYVLDSDDGAGNKGGEWSMHLWDGSLWTKTSDYDTARSDSNSAQLILTFNDSGTIPIETISDNSRITLISVEVTVPFDVAAELEINGVNIGETVSLMGNSLIDLSSTGTYAIPTDHLFSNGNDTVINAIVAPNGSLNGSATITISYQ